MIPIGNPINMARACPSMYKAPIDFHLPRFVAGRISCQYCEKRGVQQRSDTGGVSLVLSGNIWLWIGFNVFVLAMLALDLGVFHRKAHTVSIKEASIWSIVWITLALTFNAGLYFFSGPEPALQFFTGYLIEKSLSVDNIFVFVLLFTYFAVPAAYQHRVLFWGILGALLMRGIMSVLG